MQLERLSFESKEAQITMDGLKEANTELTTELDEVKQQLLDVKMSAKETSAVLDEKEKKKAEKMAKMMASFDLGGEVFSDNERSIKKIIEQVDALHEQSAAGEAIAPDELVEIKAALVETQGIVRQAELSLYGNSASDTNARRKEELEERLESLEREYEDLLERNLSEADVEEVKLRLAHAYSNKQDVQVSLVEDLKADLAQKSAEIQKFKAVNEDLQRKVKAGGVPNGGAMANGKTIQQQIAEFDVMKKSLMRDLQNRCERVVELEISLDETREQYNNVLRSSNNRAQQKKMAFLERNLEQLTHVQRQLVEQNGSLKKEVAIAERKLIARNERIQSLESLLQDSQEKLTAANHRYVLCPQVQINANKLQIRSSIDRCQGTPRSGQGWLNSRPWFTTRWFLIRWGWI
jgi:kinesin family protein 5